MNLLRSIKNIALVYEDGLSLNAFQFNSTDYEKCREHLRKGLNVNCVKEGRHYKPEAIQDVIDWCGAQWQEKVQKWTALIAAAKKGITTVAKLLIDERADIEFQDETGM